MPIRPIDIITIPPKSLEASQVQFGDKVKSEKMHIQLGEAFNQNVQKEREQTVKTTKSEREEYKFDPREESKNKYSRSKSRKRTGKDAKKDHDTKEKSGSFDMKI